MKKILIIGLCLCSALVAKGQQFSYEYEYDHAGNRISRAVFQLNRGDSDKDAQEVLCAPFSENLNNGTVMTLFPNPTKESIRFELSGGNKIGDYVLSDLTGRIILKGRCEESSLVLNLSGQTDGIYLLEILLKEGAQHYKIIKQ